MFPAVPTGRNSYHRSRACFQPSNGSHPRRGRIPIDLVHRYLACRRSNPGLQDAQGENYRRRHCTRRRWRASHHRHALGSLPPGARGLGSTTVSFVLLQEATGVGPDDLVNEDRTVLGPPHATKIAPTRPSPIVAGAHDLHVGTSRIHDGLTVVISWSGAGVSSEDRSDV